MVPPYGYLTPGTTVGDGVALGRLRKVSSLRTKNGTPGRRHYLLLPARAAMESRGITNKSSSQVHNVVVIKISHVECLRFLVPFPKR